MSMTKHEKQFMDLYIREMHLAQPEGHAHVLSDTFGITYNHYRALEPFYMEFYDGAARNWGAPYPPLPDDPNLSCPWVSKEQVEARIEELRNLVVS